MFLFFFNDTATTEIYTLSLHDALPIYSAACTPSTPVYSSLASSVICGIPARAFADRKTARLNSSHTQLSDDVSFFKKPPRDRRQRYGRASMRLIDLSGTRIRMTWLRPF